MTSISEFVLNFLVNSAWQVAAICALAALGTYLLKNCSAHYRYIVWIAALGLCFVAPVITALPSTRLDVVSQSRPQQIIDDAGNDEAVVDHTRRRNSQVVVSTTQRNIQIITVAYLLFLSLAALRFVRLWISKERLRRSISSDGLSQSAIAAMKRCTMLFGIERVELARSPSARVPYTLGVRRPLIVLPDSFYSDVDDETLLSVIAHEMAHVRRRDFLAKLVCELVSLPLAFHPLTFLIKRQIERERELACDELVTRYVLSAETYARSLLRAADLAVLPPPAAVMLSVFDGRMLEERIQQLKHKRTTFSSWAGRLITTGVLATLCVASLFGSAFSLTLRVHNTPIPPAVFNEPVVVRNNQDPVPATKRVNSPAVSRDQGAQDLALAACEATRSGDTEAVPSLIAMLGDERKTEPLRCWNGRWSPALETFKHASPGEQAALALASMGRPAFAPLVNQLDNSNAATRRNAAWAIGEFTNMLPDERGAAVPQLITLLSDADAWVRMAAARAIGELRDKRASDTLIATLSDSDWRVRRLSAWALNEMKEAKAVAALGNLLLTDARAEVRGAAAEALGEIGNAGALPSLQQALNDSESDVRAKARWAIAEIN